MYVHVSAVPVKRGCRVPWSHTTWEPRSKHGSSARPVSTLDHWAVSRAPETHFLFLCYPHSYHHWIVNLGDPNPHLPRPVKNELQPRARVSKHTGRGWLTQHNASRKHKDPAMSRLQLESSRVTNNPHSLGYVVVIILKVFSELIWRDSKVSHSAFLKNTLKSFKSSHYSDETIGLDLLDSVYIFFILRYNPSPHFV